MELNKKMRKMHRNKRGTEAEVLHAWRGGERTIEQVMEITGYSRKMVRRYIPEDEED